VKVKKVVYTAIIGKYDVLNEPKVVSEGFDYVCFTDDVTLKSPIWKIVLVTNTQGLDNTRQARKIKILCNSVLKEYDLSIWVDGSVSINCDLNIFLDENYHGEDIVLHTHPIRSCIYEEAEICIAIDKDDHEIINKQMEGYRSEGYPEGNGLVSTRLIIRNHRSKKVKEFMNSWWNEVNLKSKRDQLSFNYVLWKHQLSVGYCDLKKTFSPDFELNPSHLKPYMEKIKEKDSIIIKQQKEFDELSKWALELNKNVIEKDKWAQELDKWALELDQKCKEKDSIIIKQQKEFDECSKNWARELDKIHNSFTWKTLRKFDSFFGKNVK